MNPHPTPFILQSRQPSQQITALSPLPGGGGGHRPRYSSSSHLPTKKTHLPPTSENCLRRSWLHWRWPLYLERVQTWPLWQWGYSRTHQNAGHHQTASAWGRDLGEPQKRSGWAHSLHYTEARTPSKVSCLPSGSWSASWSRAWGRHSDPRKRQG